jgi:hypothetical protein
VVVPLGVTAFERGEAGLLPPALIATTEKRYDVPLVRPVTVADSDEAGTVAVMFPGVEVTRYD